MSNSEWWWRPAVLATMVAKSQHPPGRTVLMKMAYLLQTLRTVPLGYRFEMYNYGPYDSDVLSDLSQAASFDAIDYRIVNYPSGYGYEYALADGYQSLCDRVADRLAQIDSHIDWVVGEFGGETASQLEMYSTIVFADREMKRKQIASTANELVRRVSQIKPRFSEGFISGAIENLAERGFVELSA